MIHFRCRKCGSPVRVADLWAGSKGRCPSCKGVVEIPAAGSAGADSSPPEGTGARGEIAALAAALRGEQDDAERQVAGRPVPPPPAVEEASLDEFDLTSIEGHAAGETDILPTEQIEKLARGEKNGTAASEAPEADRPPRKRREKWLARGLKPNLPILIGAAILVIAVALAIFLFWFLP